MSTNPILSLLIKIILCEDDDCLRHIVARNPETQNIQFHHFLVDIYRKIIAGHPELGVLQQFASEDLDLENKIQRFFLILGQDLFSKATKHKHEIILEPYLNNSKKAISITQQQKLVSLSDKLTSYSTENLSLPALLAIVSSSILNVKIINTIEHISYRNYSYLIEQELKDFTSYWQSKIQQLVVTVPPNDFKNMMGKTVDEACEIWDLSPIDTLIKEIFQSTEELIDTYSEFNLHQIFCGNCCSIFFTEHWVYVHSSDTNLIDRFEKKLTHNAHCIFCKSNDALLLVSSLSVYHKYEMPVLEAMTCYEDVDYGYVIKSPTNIDTRDPNNDRIIEMCSGYLLDKVRRETPEGPRTNQMVYSEGEFTYYVMRFKEFRSHGLDSINYHQLSNAEALASGLQAGRYSLEDALNHVSKLYNTHSALWSKPFVISNDVNAVRGQSVVQLCIAIWNAVAGYKKEAVGCYLLAIESAQQEGEWGQMIDLSNKLDEFIRFVQLEPHPRLIFKIQVESYLRLVYAKLEMRDKAIKHTWNELHWIRMLLKWERNTNSNNWLIVAHSFAGVIKELANLLDNHSLFDRYKMYELAVDISEESLRLAQIEKLDEVEGYEALNRIYSGILNDMGNLMDTFIKQAEIARLISIQDESQSHGILETLIEKGVINADPLRILLDWVTLVAEFFPTDQKDEQGRVIWDDRVFHSIRERQLKHYRRAYEISTSISDHNFASRQAANLSLHYLRQKNYKLAKEYTQKSEAHARTHGGTQNLLLALVTCAEVYDKSGESKEIAFNKFKEALETWLQVRSKLMINTLRISANEASEIQRLYSTVDNYLVEEKPKDWITVLETMKSGSLSDSLNFGYLKSNLVRDNTDISNKTENVSELKFRQITLSLLGYDLNLEQKALLDHRKASLSTAILDLLQKNPSMAATYMENNIMLPAFEDLIKNIQPSEKSSAFVGYWVTYSHILVYGYKNHLHEKFAFRVSIKSIFKEAFSDRQELEPINAIIERYQSLLDQAVDFVDETEREEIGKLSQALYKLLIYPIEKITTDCENLIISPHRELYGLAWSTLKNKDGYLIERNSISVISSLYAFTQFETKNSRREKILAIGNPDLNDRRLDLPGADKEVDNLRAIASNCKLDFSEFRGENATYQNLLEQIEQQNIIHFACHAVHDTDDPEYSSLLLKSQNERIPVAFLTASEIANNFRLSKTALVVMSACETGVTKNENTNEFDGLVRSFHLAGVPVVISSLWKIDDESTQELISDFYYFYLVEELSPTKALQKAQIKMLKQDNELSSPSTWGAFFVSGM